MGRVRGTPLAGETTTEFADTCAPDDCSIAMGFLDSVHLPHVDGQPDHEAVVRPSLAILFRMAVGPAADYYAPRFLEYERTGRSFPSWNWAPLAAPGVWAIYRRLWWAGIAFSAWPLVALVAFQAAVPQLGLSGGVVLAVAALLIWLIPGIVAALVANTLVYRRARRLVQYAESRTTKTDKAARWLSHSTVIAPMPAMMAAAMVFVTAGAAVPTLDSAYSDQLVRSRIAESLVALQPLQRQLEGWFLSRSPSDAPPLVMVDGRPESDSPEIVSVSVTNGRVRLALDLLGPELSGRSILLAPAIDRRLQVRWICIPVDVPAKFLPPECRQG
jgi:hypothetical protein